MRASSSARFPFGFVTLVEDCCIAVQGDEVTAAGWPQFLQVPGRLMDSSCGIRYSVVNGYPDLPAVPLPGRFPCSADSALNRFEGDGDIPLRPWR